MADHFEVGEVAIFHDPGGTHHGVEVTITSRLHGAWLRRLSTGEWSFACGHDIESPALGVAPMGNGWCAPVENLRKRRPPQDWVKLCRLSQVPQIA